MIIKKIQKAALPLYIVFILLSFFYVKSVLKEGDIKIIEESNKKEIKEIKPLKVYLNIETFGSVNSIEVSSDNKNNLIDVLEDLRNEDVIRYEKTYYTDKIVLSYSDNNYFSEKKYEWRIYYDGNDITNEVVEFNLQNDQEFRILLREAET